MGHSDRDCKRTGSVTSASQSHCSEILQLGIGRGQGQPRIAGEESFEADLGFDPGELGSQTEVHARAEAQVRVGAAQRSSFSGLGKRAGSALAAPSQATMVSPRRSDWPRNSRSRIT